MYEVTRILSQLEEGDSRAVEMLLPLVYEELRRLAAARLAQENPGHTLQATALVHEAYLRLIGPANQRGFDNRGHFFSAAACAMRRILVEQARRKNRKRHGEGVARVELQESEIVAPLPDQELLALDEALARFAELEPLKARLVELRYFVGLTNEQAAELLGISAATAKRHWRYARAWLHQAVTAEDELTDSQQELPSG